MQAQGQPTTGQIAGSRCRVPKSLADLRRRGGRDVGDHRRSPVPTKAPQDFA